MSDPISSAVGAIASDPTVGQASVQFVKDLPQYPPYVVLAFIAGFVLIALAAIGATVFLRLKNSKAEASSTAGAEQTTTVISGMGQMHMQALQFTMDEQNKIVTYMSEVITQLMERHDGLHERYDDLRLTTQQQLDAIVHLRDAVTDLVEGIGEIRLLLRMEDRLSRSHLPPSPPEGAVIIPMYPPGDAPPPAAAGGAAGA